MTWISNDAILNKQLLGNMYNVVPFEQKGTRVTKQKKEIET